MAEYNSKVLIEFSTIVDIDLGIIKLIQLKYNNEKYMKPHVLYGELNFIKSLLVMRNDPNPLSIIVKKEYIFNIDKMINDIIEADMDEILKLSPPTAVFGLVETYKKTGEVINCTILCKDIQEEQYIKNLDSSLNTKVVKERKLIDTNLYDAYFIKNYKDVLEYKNMAGKSLFISRYQYNLEKDKTDIPLLEVSIHIVDINKVYTIMPYLNFKLPEIIPDGKDVIL